LPVAGDRLDIICPVPPVIGAPLLPACRIIFSQEPIRRLCGRPAAGYPTAESILMTPRSSDTIFADCVTRHIHIAGRVTGYLHTKIITRTSVISSPDAIATGIKLHQEGIPAACRSSLLCAPESDHVRTHGTPGKVYAAI